MFNFFSLFFAQYWIYLFSRVAAVEQGVLLRLPAGSRDPNVTLTTDNGTQFTSPRFLETAGRLGIPHRRTAYHHTGG
jgi:transposase InsO family protein